MRPLQQDHDNEKTTYNNQLNGGLLAVEEVEVEAEVRGGVERWKRRREEEERGGGGGGGKRWRRQ